MRKLYRTIVEIGEGSRSLGRLDAGERTVLRWIVKGVVCILGGEGVNWVRLAPTCVNQPSSFMKFWEYELLKYCAQRTYFYNPSDYKHFFQQLKIFEEIWLLYVPPTLRFRELCFRLIQCIYGFLTVLRKIHRLFL